MQQNWSQYLRLMIALLGLTLLLGWLVGFPLYGLLAGLLLYLGWTLAQTKRLLRWLAQPDTASEAPDSVGLWGTIFDGLNKLQKQHIKHRSALQERLQRVQQSANAMRDGVVMTDSRGAIDWWNGSAGYLLNLRSTTDQGQLIQNLIRLPAFIHYFEHKQYQQPLELDAPARAHLRLQIQISLFGDNDRLLLIKDVTRLHQLEQVRRDFVSNLSHEMRTPLTVISGYLETLADHSDEVPAHWQRAVFTMADQSARLEALVADLILLSKIETGDRNLHEGTVDAGTLLRQACDDANTLSGSKQHRIELTIDGPTQIRGDLSQLRSGVSNLIFNAVKYTPAQGQIRVRWSAGEQGPLLTVEDNGIGIDPAHIPRLTERFYRADPSRHKDTGGTGLGLAIVKHVLLNHDGQLLISSSPGKGSTFSCQFPAQRIVAGEALPLASGR